MDRKCFCDTCIECRLRKLELAVFHDHVYTTAEVIDLLNPEPVANVEEDTPLPDTILPQAEPAGEIEGRAWPDEVAREAEANGESGAGSGA